MGDTRGRQATALLLLLATTAGCALRTRGPDAAGPGGRAFTATVPLHGHALALHLATPSEPAAARALVLYASGDGGWFGAATDMFRRIARAGYYAVGFSSRAFLRIDRPRGALVNPAQLAGEYAAILSAARRDLALPDSTPVVLTGWSRGAAFAVLAGAEPALETRVAGIVAVGLAKDEDLAADDAASDDDEGESATRSRTKPFDTYGHLARLGALRCAVVQATQDHYLPAVEARQRFGPDSDTRRFYSVAASNHRFSGGKEALGAAIADALAWITRQAG